MWCVWSAYHCYGWGSTPMAATGMAYPVYYHVHPPAIVGQVGGLVVCYSGLVVLPLTAHGLLRRCLRFGVGAEFLTQAVYRLLYRTLFLNQSSALSLNLCQRSARYVNLITHHEQFVVTSRNRQRR